MLLYLYITLLLYLVAIYTKIFPIIHLTEMKHALHIFYSISKPVLSYFREIFTDTSLVQNTISI